MNIDTEADHLLNSLAAKADPAFAARMQRYFPAEIKALGISNADIVRLASTYFQAVPDVPAAVRLKVTEEILARAGHHEEVLLGFALLHKVARPGLGEDFLDRCLEWLERYVSNWAQCDDLCLKLLYPYFLGHPDLIPRTQQWIGSPSNWARRAANVALVKFVRYKVGRTTYEIPLDLVFQNCTRLMDDEDEYVQKGCGWLLKVAGKVHPHEVSAFLRTWHGSMRRVTFRYAVENLDDETRASLMALGRRAQR